jgi:hypothetical protein
MTAFTRIMVGLYLAIAALPLAVMALELPDHEIFGALPPAELPEPSVDEFRSEGYQKAYTAWFESRLGGKGYSIATDNTILYRLFRDTKPGSAVGLGRRGVLFKDEDLAYYNKDGDDLPPQAKVDALADKIGALQALLAAHHRALVPLIIPSKTTLYRRDVPPLWTRDLGQPRPSDLKVYDAMKRALDARHIRYVDARALFTAPGVVPEQVWGRQGRHWTTYGACLAMRDVMRDYAALAGLAAPAYDCLPAREWRPTAHDHFDLWNLLNLWRPPRINQLVPLVQHAAPPPASATPSVMFVGTSFCWNIMYDATASQRFGEMHMDYYNRTLVAWPADIHTDVRPYTKEWRDVFLGKDLYVLDLLEVFLLAPDTYVDEFLAEVGGQLERTLGDAPGRAKAP